MSQVTPETRKTEADTLKDNAARHPDKVALVFEDRTTDYATLDRRANCVANGLLEISDERQQRIAILSKNSDLYFEILFGVLRSGKTLLPLNWRLALPELASIIKDSGATTLFLEPEFSHYISSLRSLGVTVEKTISIDAMDYAAWRDEQSLSEPSVAVNPEDIFVQLYTSGTTGQPKGVQISHRASMEMRVIETSFKGKWTEWGPDEVSIVAMPNFHISGTNWGLLWLARGATCIVLAQADAKEILGAIEKHGVTWIFTVPTVLSLMLEDDSCEHRDFSSLKYIQYGGSPIHPDLLVDCMKRFGCGFVQTYGMTEVNGVVTALRPEDHDPAEPRLLKSVGKPYPALDVKIMNSKGPISQGKIGEICIRSRSLMSGYWKKPGATEECRYGDFYRSGDGGYFDADGYLYLVDRIKDMIVTGGENVYPAEVENALLDHPSVAEVAVIGIPEDRWGEIVMAVVVPTGSLPNSEDLIRFVRKRIASYKAPRIVQSVDALPRNATGKVLKHVLRQTYKKAAKSSR